MDNKQISEEKINEIRKSVDIVDVISTYLPLTSKGRNFFGVCPFHADHSPSMSVSKDKQIYRCFSCGASGNVLKFIMDYENISFVESLKIVSELGGIELNVKGISKPINKNTELYEIFDLSHKLYQNNINTEQGLEAKKYLKDRNIDNEIIKEFEIGLSLKNNKILTSMLENKNYKKNTMLNTGLIGENDKGIHDVFYNRLMFPLYDLTGKVVSYSGRIFDSEEKPKYLTTKETEIFKKGELLYNYHKAKDYARKQNQIIIMEGFMDVIAAYKVGIKNVVATMGTAVTKEQAILIKRLAKEVILLFDGDEAGEKATFACSDELSKIGVIPKIVRLENNLDPDDYINKFGEKKFIEKLNNPISVLDFKLTYLKKNKNLDDNIDFASYINSAINETSKIEDEILVELTLQKLSSESNISINVLRDKLNKLKTNTEDKNNIEVKKEINKNEITSEKNLLYYMLNSKEVVTIFSNNAVYLPTEEYRLLAKEIVAIYKETKEVNIADIMTTLFDNESYMKTINKLLSLELKDEYKKEDITSYIREISIYNIKKEKDRLKSLMHMEIERDKKSEIAQKITELKKQQLELEKEGYENGK